MVKKNFQAFPLIGVINLCTIIESSWTKPVEGKYQSFHLWWIAKLLIQQANFESMVYNICIDSQRKNVIYYVQKHNPIVWNVYHHDPSYDYEYDFLPCC